MKRYLFKLLPMLITVPMVMALPMILINADTSPQKQEVKHFTKKYTETTYADGNKTLSYHDTNFNKTFTTKKYTHIETKIFLGDNFFEITNVYNKSKTLYLDNLSNHTQDYQEIKENNIFHDGSKFLEATNLDNTKTGYSRTVLKSSYPYKEIHVKPIISPITKITHKFYETTNLNDTYSLFGGVEVFLHNDSIDANYTKIKIITLELNMYGLSNFPDGTQRLKKPEQIIIQ